MTQAQVGDMVKVHYTGRLADGTTFDTSLEREPLEFTLGEGELIAGFEHAVLGMAAGESKTTTIPADQAYGPHHAERVIQVERHHLPSDLQPELGQQLQMTRPDGTTLTVMITTVKKEKTVIKGNKNVTGKRTVVTGNQKTVVGKS